MARDPSPTALPAYESVPAYADDPSHGHPPVTTTIATATATATTASIPTSSNDHNPALSPHLEDGDAELDALIERRGDAVEDADDHGEDEQWEAPTTTTSTTTTTPGVSTTVDAATSTTSLPNRAAAGKGTPRLHRPAADGVFSNLSAKPELPSPPPPFSPGDHPQNAPHAQQETLPSYAAVANDTVPPYPIVILNDHGQLVEETTVNGYPLGGFFPFALSLLVTLCFQWVGFLVAIMASATYSGKLGARAGLGLVLVNYAFFLRNYSTRYEYDEDLQMIVERPMNERELDSAGNVWISYILMVIGWFMVLQSTSEYVRLRRMQAQLAVTATVAELNV